MRADGAAPRRIVILAEGRLSSLGSKTANAALLYLQNEVVAVIDSTKEKSTVQELIGIGGAIPLVHSLEEALQFHPSSLLIGIAPIGGQLPGEWRTIICQAIEHGLDIISGLHQFFSQDHEFKSLAKKHGVLLHDLRKIPSSHNIIAQGSWRRRKAKTILTVGTDSNIGKLTTALQIYRNMQQRGMSVAFVGTGQTGILIGERGVAVDAVVADFIAGAVEYEIDKAVNEGYEYIIVEGQGALTHCGFSGVTLGLMHGVMPDAMIMCHQPTREIDWYGLPLIPLDRAIKLHEELVSVFKKSKVVGIAINSIGINKDEMQIIAGQMYEQFELPATDPLRNGARVIVDALLQYFSSFTLESHSVESVEIRDRIY